VPRTRFSRLAGLAAWVFPWAVCLDLSGCARLSGKPAGPTVHLQGLHGRFEVMGGVQAPATECQDFTSPTERARCEKEFQLQAVWPLKGYAVIRSRRGDSTVLALDSAGGYRVALPVGFYSVCVDAEGISASDRCRDSLEVKAGAYTLFSRPFPRLDRSPDRP
jgi:hypothetical protein